ncbi:porin family protein [Mesorhizobium sp. B2-5-13]|uniref:outer membrane protein n=1 Tax=unclassified Mesorhizobium TaxID=325217 RepID=UPI00112C5786|nr:MULTISPECIES: outer membrane protein [unclassified Mesorhizobium]TPJ85346.1 porin family protein [Mesorhizobium sp. B2-5-13]TPK49448.1 porin family protein [Mesorhizobium sp. B2-5-5]
MQANFKFARPLAVALGLFALGGTAYAADVVSEEPPAPAPVAELPVASWAGPYAGINLGYGFSGKTKEKDFGVSTDTKGFVGSVFGGYQWQQENFVYGGEAELGYNGVKGDDNGINSKGGFEGSLRARLGYAVTPEILLYGTGGLAGRSLKVEDTVLGASDTATMLGWTAGVGTDIKLTDNVFGRVEYRYTDFGSKSFDGIGKVKATDNRVNFGLGMKF